MTPTEFRTQRLKLGLTQEQAATVLGLTSRQIQNYEYGKNPVPFTVCFTLIHLSKRDVKKLLTDAK